MEAVRLGSGSQIMHECLDGQAVPLRVEGHAISDDLHWSFLVDNNVNKAVEISEQPGIDVHINNVHGSQMAAKITAGSP